jgi:hypothetical protein
MRRPLAILATVGIIAMCALILLGVSLPMFIPTSRFVHVGGVGPLGFELYRFGIYVTYQRTRWFNFSVFLPAALLGAPSLIYLMLGTIRGRREKQRIGFAVVQDDQTSAAE